MATVKIPRNLKDQELFCLKYNDSIDEVSYKYVSSISSSPKPKVYITVTGSPGTDSYELFFLMTISAVKFSSSSTKISETFFCYAGLQEQTGEVSPYVFNGVSSISNTNVFNVTPHPYPPTGTEGMAFVSTASVGPAYVNVNITVFYGGTKDGSKLAVQIT